MKHGRRQPVEALTARLRSWERELAIVQSMRQTVHRTASRLIPAQNAVAELRRRIERTASMGISKSRELLPAKVGPVV